MLVCTTIFVRTISAPYMHNGLCIRCLLLFYLLGREGAVLVDGRVGVGVLSLDPALVVQVLEGCGTQREEVNSMPIGRKRQ